MKAAILAESLTGNTWKAAEKIGNLLQQEGWSITGINRVRQPDHQAIQAADMILVGTWVHGLFIVGQAPFGLGTISHLPSMKGKKAAVFCTYALNPAKSVEKLNRVVLGLGASSMGGVALHRAKLDAHCEEFVGRVLDNLAGTNAA